MEKIYYIPWSNQRDIFQFDNRESFQARHFPPFSIKQPDLKDEEKLRKAANFNKRLRCGKVVM